MLGVFSPEFSPTCRFFDRQERTWRELSNLFRAYEFPGFALFWGCARRRKALRSLAFWLPLSSAKRILISGAFRGSQKTRNQLMVYPLRGFESHPLRHLRTLILIQCQRPFFCPKVPRNKGFPAIRLFRMEVPLAGFLFSSPVACRVFLHDFP